jgi:hypothetical protein
MNHSLLPKTANASLPATYEAAKLAIMECSRIDECKDWADKAQALASYARQSEDMEMEKTAGRIRARAIRRCGELLKEIEKKQGANQNIKAAAGPKVETRKSTAADAGMSERQAKTAIRVANVPQETFLDQVESDDPPTITKLADQGKQQPKAKPMYEQLGISKEAFQAGMYFRGDMESFLKATEKYKIGDIIEGSNPKQRERMREIIGKIDKFNDKLISKL